MKSSSNFKSVYIVIPAYNERKIIRQVIKRVKKEGYKNIIVVDDGSDDKTFLYAKREEVCVLRHILNRGKGAAIKTGIEAAKHLRAQSVVTIDADGQHNPEEIHFFLNKIKEGFDIVLGTRSMSHDEMPVVKIIANYLGNYFTWFLYGVWVHDSQSGFRAYSKKAMQLMDTKNDRYEYDSEVIREIRRNKLLFCEIPIETRYSSYSLTKSQKQSFINGIRTLAKMVISS